MPAIETREVRDIAPRAWAAICQLMGGEERIAAPVWWGDAFIANYRLGAERAWLPPGPAVTGWHKDGDFFLHFLDSPEQGLLAIVLWDDVLPRGGGTFVCCDSVGHIARFLAEHPEGVDPFTGFPNREFINRCHDFREATGQAGDVYLMHPFMLHASSQNALRRPRFITNPPAAFREPMDFARPDPSRSSARCCVDWASIATDSSPPPNADGSFLSAWRRSRSFWKQSVYAAQAGEDGATEQAARDRHCLPLVSV